MSTSNTQLNHLQIPLDEIQKATNNFSEKNIIGKGGFGNVYKGQLLRSGELINVSARRLDRSQGQGDMEFWTEISVLSGLKHPNIVSLIGFCDEKGEKIIIHRYEAKRSLSMYLSDPALTWIQRLKISIGVAEAISYLHHEEGRNYYILHRNINSSTILLDNNFEAKLSGFEFSIKHSVDRMERYISSEVIGTQGYMDPETLKSGDVTQKSDVYAYGVVLCEILCGRKAFLPDESKDNKFLAPLVTFCYGNKLFDKVDIIHPDVRNQINSDIYYGFARLARDCTKEDRVERPDMSYIIADLAAQLHSVIPLESLFKDKKDENDTSEEESKDTYENDALEGESKDTDENTSSNAWKVCRSIRCTLTAFALRRNPSFFSFMSVNASFTAFLTIFRSTALAFAEPRLSLVCVKETHKNNIQKGTIFTSVISKTMTRGSKMREGGSGNGSKWVRFGWPVILYSFEHTWCVRYDCNYTWVELPPLVRYYKQIYGKSAKDIFCGDSGWQSQYVNLVANPPIQ